MLRDMGKEKLTIEKKIVLARSVLDSPFYMETQKCVKRNLKLGELSDASKQQLYSYAAYLMAQRLGYKVLKAQELVENNVSFARYMTKKYTPENRVNEELLDLAVIGLVKAAYSYMRYPRRMKGRRFKLKDKSKFEYAENRLRYLKLFKDDIISKGGTVNIPSKKAKLKDKKIQLVSYASRCIENEIGMALKSENKFTKNTMSIELPIGTDKEGNELHLEDILGTEPDETESRALHNEERDMIDVVSSKLKKKDRKVFLRMYDIDNDIKRTQRAVAEEFGISKSYVSRIEKRVIKIFKEEWEKNGYKLK